MSVQTPNSSSVCLSAATVRISLKRSLTGFSISIFCWKRHWDRDSGNAGGHGLQWWSGDTCKSLQDHIPHTSMNTRWSASTQSVFRAWCLMCPNTCIPSHGCLRAHNNEPESCSLASCFIPPGWSSVERGDTSWSGRHPRQRQQSPGQERYQLLSVKTYWSELFPEQRSISSLASHTKVI